MKGKPGRDLGEHPKAAIVLHDGAFDRVHYGLTIAQVALARGLDVHVFCTYGALQRFVKGRLDRLGGETDPELRPTLAARVADGGLQPLGQVLKDAKQLGLHLYACPGAMATLNITRDELVDEVDTTMGLATFLGIVQGAEFSLYI